MRERLESRFATLIMVASCVTIAGVFLLMIGMGSGTMQMVRGQTPAGASVVVSALGAIGLLGGIGMLVFVMFFGATIGVTENRGIRKTDPNTRVIARYATNARGETLPLEWDFPDPDTKFFVRMEISGGQRVEFRCVKEVFLECGEGMRGESQFQGRWLGMFKPYIGVQPIVQQP